MTVGQSKKRRPTRNIFKDAAQSKLMESITQDIADIEQTVSDQYPVGMIMMYDGTAWVDNVTIRGFYICDGRFVAGYGVDANTPNLVGYFMKGAATSGATTAAATHTHVIAATTSTRNDIQGGGAQTLPTSIHTHVAAATTAPDPANYTVIFVKKMHE